MNLTRLRTLTQLSKLKFGNYKDYTVSQMLQTPNLRLELISAYYKLSKINFTDEVLDELGISQEMRIEKPSKDLEKYNLYFGDSKANYGKENFQKKVNDIKMKTRFKGTTLTKAVLKHLNNKIR